MTPPLSLVADIGGTNTRVALSRGAQVDPDTIRRYSNHEHASLADTLALYLASTGARVQAACVALAGPVRGGVGRMTNLDWEIDTDTLKRTTNASKAFILNDLQAQGHALRQLRNDQLCPVLSGRTSAPDAAQLVVGVGTGFNIAAVLGPTDHRMVTASETGHMALPARTAADLALIQHLSGTGRAEIEAALSGPGLVSLYRWQTLQAGSPRTASGPEILAAAAQQDPAASQSLRLFLRLLGDVVGDLALSYLPFGGVFLVGGMARAVSPYLSSHGMTEAFADRGRFATLMQDFPLSVVTDDYAALTGCAARLQTD